MSGFNQKVCFNLKFRASRSQHGYKPIVTEGSEVLPEQGLLISETKHEFIEVSLSQYYSVSKEQFRRGLLVKQGDKIRKGDPLFIKKGLLGLGEISMVSPVDGEVLIILEDRQAVILSFNPERKLIPAFYKGTVLKIENNSVEIEGVGHLLQCVYGVGGDVFGKILNLRKYNETLRESDLDKSMAGYILVGIKTVTPDAVKLAREIGVRGIILAHASEEVFDVLGVEVSSNVSKELDFALCLTERFSESELQLRVIKFFEMVDGLDCSVSARTQIRAGSIRPEIWVWGDEISISSEPGYRVTVDPYWNYVFASAEFCKNDVTFPSGIICPGVKLRGPLLNTTIKAEVTVPAACIEEIDIFN